MTRIIPVDDPQAPELAPFRDLVGPRDASAPMVIEGFTAMQRLVDAGHPLGAVLTTPAALPRLENWLPPDVPRWVAPSQLLREIVGFAFHRGALALAPRPAYRPPAQLRTLVVAERITDPSNVGALIRNARALGADALWLDAASGDPFGRRAIRTSMGWCFSLPIRQAPLAPALDALRARQPGLQCIAASCSPGATPVTQSVWPQACALLLGNEGFGLSEELLQLADAHVTIPMDPAVDSLNVAAASAILLYQRGLKAAAPPPPR